MNNMRFTGKESRENLKIYYLNGQNAAEALRVYRRKHGQCQGPCTAKAVRDMIRSFEETGCTCYRSLSERPSVPIEAVAEIHQTISEVPLPSAQSASRILQFRHSRIPKILLSVLHIFPYWFQRALILQAGYKQQRLDFAHEFFIG